MCWADDDPAALAHAAHVLRHVVKALVADAKVVAAERLDDALTRALVARDGAVAITEALRHDRRSCCWR